MLWLLETTFCPMETWEGLASGSEHSQNQRKTVRFSFHWLLSFTPSTVQTTSSTHSSCFLPAISLFFPFTGMWDLSYPIRDWTCALCSIKCGVLTTGPPGKSCKLSLFIVCTKREGKFESKVVNFPFFLNMLCSFLLQSPLHCISVAPTEWYLP